MTSLAACLMLPALAHAQLRLPSMPNLPALPAPGLPMPGTLNVQRQPAPLADLARQRRQRIDEMLRRHAELIETDPAGEPVVRGETVLVSPSAELLSAALAEGFTVLRERRLDALDLRFVTLRAPQGWDTRRALNRLRELDPQAEVDFNHLYLDSGELRAVGTSTPAPIAPTPAAASSIKIGLIDSGVETLHPLLQGADIHAWGCRSTKIANAHGTAVASLLVGRGGDFRSAVPGATLYAADVYCDDPEGGSVEAVAGALAWLAGEQVPVINISLVGPANRALEAVVRRVSAKGMLLVAAVGNDGPAAAPLYPAAYPGVVAVTAVDAHRRVIAEACRGPHVAFAAPGADMAVASLDAQRFATARGTSFAAPLVARLLAASLRAPDAEAARLAVEALARQAIDLGAPGRDVVYGHGLVAGELRTDPPLGH